MFLSLVSVCVKNLHAHCLLPLNNQIMVGKKSDYVRLRPQEQDLEESFSLF